MNVDILKNELKKEIEEKRTILNKMIVEEKDKKKILKYSEELDKLIGKYYKLELNKK